MRAHTTGVVGRKGREDAATLPPTTLRHTDTQAQRHRDTETHTHARTYQGGVGVGRVGVG